jgi:ubiquinone/menaquinone biosynthesis C-methylase UbiE/predicted transcriptional regulator
MDPNTIREIAASFQRSRILLTGIELDLFSNIGEAGSSGHQIATRLNLNENACVRLLNALVSMGFLTKEDEVFFNTPESATFLSGESPAVMGGLKHTNHLWDTWSNLTEVVRTGIPAHREDINDRGEEWLFAFISAMHDRAKKQAPRQLSGVELSGIQTMLDVGGGSGAYAMEFIHRKPEIEATIFDLSRVVPITREFIHKEGFADKIKTFEGDYTVDELPAGFDLVFLSAVLHSNSLEVNRTLIKKCFSALNRNGRIVIQDWIMNQDRTEPAVGAIFSINMLVGTGAGDCFTEQEVKDMLHAAGFQHISRVVFETGLSQVTAQKI